MSYGDRFWSKVNKTETCWLWTAGLRNGYGNFNVIRDGRWRTDYAHRVAYRELVGEIPTDLQLDHLCRTPRCVNPEHLEPVTPGENLRRGVSPSAMNRHKTHCKHGHAFDEANTYTTRQGTRCCRTCAAAWQRARRAAA